ncbi:MAG: hypothetical protein KAI29_13910, partial [Cyclobacteriaceae bacterium]|nr:hypothetical protein [Cyclobacteriaceae bacterium]
DTYWSTVWAPSLADQASKNYSQESSQFLNALEKEYPGKAINSGSPMPYSAIKMLLLAMDKADSISDLKKIHQAYNELNFIAPTGNKLTVENCGLIEWEDLYLSQVQKGKIVVIDKVPYKSFSETYITGLK